MEVTALQYSYVARQPILNREKTLFAYELLFRDGPNNGFPDIDPDEATSRLVSDNFLSVHTKISHNAYTFVNFPYKSLINSIPTLIPNQKLVVEILEDCKPTPELLSAVRNMAVQGYKFALDDFIPRPEWKAFLPYVHYIKFDIRIVPIEKARPFIEKLKNTKIVFIAEKVETYEEFEEAKDAGFHLFQGYFFSKPEVLQQKKLEPSMLTVIQLCKEITCHPINYDKVESLVSQDVSLSYKLLTLVNSSVNVCSKIQSFKQAIVYLGEDRLRKFVSLLAIASSGTDKPQYLYHLCIQTARFCEQLAVERRAKTTEPGSAFLTGMLCYIDSILDQPLEELLEDIPIDSSVKAALLNYEGDLGQILKLTHAYEQADWQTVAELTDALSLNVEQVATCHDESIQWSAELFSQLPK